MKALDASLIYMRPMALSRVSLLTVSLKVLKLITKMRFEAK